MQRKFTLLSIALILCFQHQLFAQIPVEAGGGKFVQVIKANKFVRVKQEVGGDLNLLVGNVLMKQNNTLFYCDSAIQNVFINQVEAFGNIHINDNDSVHTYSQYMKYDGNAKIAQLKNKVRLTDGKGVLTTEALEYQVDPQIGTYLDGGKVVNGESVLTSKIGIYYANTREVYFQKNVKLVDPEYRMTTDTLLYNVNTEVANFVSPTVINDGKTKILTKSGFYDLKKGNASFTKRPVIIDSVQTVIADSIFYNKKTGEGLANGDVTYKDSAQGISMRAGAAQFNNQSKSINAYKRPLMALKQNTDSIYIAADTLFSAYLKRDSTKKIMADTIRFFSAFYDVKIFSDSLQGKSDSLFYSGFDSTFSFYKEPVIWAEGSQISGDTIYLVTRNKKPDQVFVNENAYSINRTNEGLYNQLKGKNMNGQFINGEIDFLRAKGNSESLYYLQDDDSSYIGMNYAMADAITMKFINKELKRVTWVNGVSGTTYPMNKIPEDKKQLRNFKWLDALRPKTLEDLYKK
jgi:lipopolysaccharide export system protein LptA